MVQYRAVVKGMDFDKIAKDIDKDVTELKRDFLTSMAEVISQTSPIDSGNYAINHEVALRSGSYTSNKVRPDEDSRISRDGAAQYPSAREEGLESMISDINTLVQGDSNNFVFRNPMTYSPIVEAEHAVYSRAKREVIALLQQSVAKVRSR